MARPKKEQEEKRIHRVSVRLTDAELVRVSETANRAGMTQSAYIRQMAVAGRVVVKQEKTDFALVNQLRRIGVNLNQMTRLLHTPSGIVPAELVTTLARLEALLDLVQVE